MKLSIGILAYNESDSITVLLQSLCRQSLLNSLDEEWIVEIIVVPNGCSDSTALIAHNTLEKLAIENDRALWNWKVCEVQEAGKSNAWNLFIHQFAAPDADFFCLMDADIQLHDRNALEKMLKMLVKNPEYWIALDQPIKDKDTPADISFRTTSFRGSTELTAGMLIDKMNQENHFWLDDFVHNSLAKKRWWIIPFSLVFRRYRSLRNYSLGKALLRIPIATLAFMIDISIFVRANIILHRTVVTNYW